MGDRCSIEIWVPRKYAEKAEDILAFSPADLGPHDDRAFVCFYDAEANYALYDERQKLTDAKIPFYGNHSAGGDYEAYVFASNNGTQYQCWQIAQYPVVRLDRYGNVIESDLILAGNYMAVKRMVQKTYECSCPLAWSGHGDPIPDHKRLDAECPVHGQPEERHA